MSLLELTKCCAGQGYYCADMESHYLETWAEMEKLVDEGLTKTIGLSNFNRRQVHSSNIPELPPRPTL